MTFVIPKGSILRCIALMTTICSIALATFFVAITLFGKYCSINKRTAYAIKTETQWRSERETNPADGCWHVFIDAGANRGVQVRKLFEPHLYPSSGIEALFKEAFGTPRQRGRDVCAFGFEGHPMFFARLREIESRYRSKGLRVSFMTKLVGTTSTNVTFFMDQTRKHDGSSVIQRDKTKGSHTVETVDFAKFVRQVGQRRFPSQHGSRPRTVLMKMDIEGSEFLVVPHLIAENVLCDVNLTMIEWHERHFFSGQVPDFFPSSFKNPSTVGNACETVKQDTGRYISRVCPWNRITDVDDESYNSDRKPLK